jgi:phosphatidylglycerophosphate synthase
LKLYGLTLLERNLRALEPSGVSRVTCLTTEADAPLVRRFLEEKSPWQFAHDVFATPPTVAHNFVLDARTLVAPPVFKHFLAQTTANVVEAEGKSLTFTTNVEGEKGKKTTFSAAELNALPQGFFLPVRNEAERIAAKKALRHSLIKPSDGWVSKHLNRPISISISRMLAYTAITPNQFSIFTGLLGIGTGVLLAQGGYWGFFLGALGFHLTSVLDGVDGELARLKFKASPLGQWLDTLVDNTSYIFALAGYLFGLFRDGASGFEKTAGITALTFMALALGSMYFYLKRFNKGGSLLNVEYSFQEGKTTFDRSMQTMSAFGRRDLFALIFFGLGAIGQLRMALVYIGILTAALFGFSIHAHITTAKKLRAAAIGK